MGIVLWGAQGRLQGRAGQGGTRLCLGCEKEARKERRYVSWGVGEEVDFFFLRCFIMFFFSRRREGKESLRWDGHACRSSADRQFLAHAGFFSFRVLILLFRLVACAALHCMSVFVHFCSRVGI